MTKVNPDFIIELRGKQYITYEGLLDLAHNNGLKSITTELLSYQGVGKEAVVKATATGEHGTFTGLGDACPQNVGKGIATCTLRMAETRAKARALRDFNNVGMCAVEELPPDEPAQRVAAPVRPSNHYSKHEQRHREEYDDAPEINDATLKKMAAVDLLPDPPCPKCGGETRRTKRWENPNGSKAPWYSCRAYDFKTKSGCNGGVWDLPKPQAEMDGLDAADRYDDSLDYNTEDPPF